MPANGTKNLKPVKKGEVRNPTGANGRISRTLPLEILFKAFENNHEKFKTALEDEAKKDIVKFYEKRVEPHLPKEWEPMLPPGSSGFKITVETK